MAGDSDLAARGSTPPTRRHSHDPEELALWMGWFVRARWVVPFVIGPGAWLIHHLLGTPFDTPAILVVALASVVINGMTALQLRRYREDPARYAAALRRLASFMTLSNILMLAIAVHFAGGATGLFWPFPFVPLVISAAMLPSSRTLVVHGGFAIIVTTISTHAHGVAQTIAPIMLALLFVAFSAALTYTVARRLGEVRDVRRELDRVRGDKVLVEAVARRREEILSVVSHELASPLMTLRGYVRLLKETKGRERTGQHLLERIDRQVDRLSGLADDLLEMASTKAGALRLHRTSFDLIDMLREVRDGARLQFPEAEIMIVGEATVAGAWDRDRLDQLFGNLISNAVKFGGARCRVAIDVKRENEREILVRVSDDGPGISADALRTIFEPFQRYSAERGGLGLGLAIVQSIVELHTGRIWAESPDGRGASFHLVLPTDAKPSGQHAIIDGVELAGTEAGRA